MILFEIKYGDNSEKTILILARTEEKALAEFRRQTKKSYSWDKDFSAMSVKHKNVKLAK